MKDKLPAIQFYVGDWKKDAGVQALDLEERGAWIEMLFLMNESDQRGKLMLNGNPMPMFALARNLGIDEAKCKQIVSKILALGVASQEQDSGVIYCRRMVRDEGLRQKRAIAGKQGGEAKSKQTRKQKPSKPSSKTEANRGSSFSLSSSFSSSNQCFNGPVVFDELNFDSSSEHQINELEKKGFNVKTILCSTIHQYRKGGLSDVKNENSFVDILWEAHRDTEKYTGMKEKNAVLASKFKEYLGMKDKKGRNNNDTKNN